jgi:hypothetical protein
MLNQLQHTTSRSCDNRPTHRHGFSDRSTKWFGARTRMDHDVERGVGRSNIRLKRD